MRIPTLSLPADPPVHLVKKCRGTGQGLWTLGINPEMSSEISCCRDDSCQRLEKDKEFYGPQNWANKGVQQDVSDEYQGVSYRTSSLCFLLQCDRLPHGYVWVFVLLSVPSLFHLLWLIQEELSPLRQNTNSRTRAALLKKAEEKRRQGNIL